MKKTNKNTLLKLLLRIFLIPAMFVTAILVIPCFILFNIDFIKEYFEKYYHYYMRSDWTEEELKEYY